MGIYDRDYARDDRHGFHLGADLAMVTNLLLITVAVYVVQLLADYGNPRELVTKALGLPQDLFGPSLLTQPWRLAKLVTYGFAHAPHDLKHIVFNMFALWFFGRDLEGMYGRKRFAWFYVTAIILAGLGWMACEIVASGGLAGGPPLIGASGGVTAVGLLFVVWFPRRTIWIWGVLPLPAWALGVLWVLGDLSGAVNRTSNVAFTAHLTGAAYGLIYYRTRWSLDLLLPSRVSVARLRSLFRPGGSSGWRRPKLRVLDAEDAPPEPSLEAKVDEILQKIQAHGQDSLTPAERHTLEEASRRYQDKHR